MGQVGRETTEAKTQGVSRKENTPAEHDRGGEVIYEPSDDMPKDTTKVNSPSNSTYRISIASFVLKQRPKVREAIRLAATSLGESLRE